MSAVSKRAGQLVQSRARLIPILPFVIPLLLMPLAAGWWWRGVDFAQLNQHREDLLFAYLVYIVIVRFALLDLMLFYVSRKCSFMHLDLIHITAVQVILKRLLRAAALTRPHPSQVIRLADVRRCAKK